MILSTPERTWLTKYHEKCSGCISPETLLAIARQHTEDLDPATDRSIAAAAITQAHRLRVTGKSSPAEADASFRQIIEGAKP